MTRKENQSVVFANQNRNLLPEDLPTHTIANAPDPAVNEGRLIYVTDGAGGLPIMAFCDGTNWLRSDTRTVIFDPITLFANGEEGVLFDRMNPADGFLFQDDKGRNPATGPDQPLGLMLDRSQGPSGPELFIEPITVESPWLDLGGGTYSNDGSSGDISEISVAASAVPDASYLMEFDITVAATTGSARTRVGALNGSGHTQVNSYSEILVANSNESPRLRGSAGFNGTVSNLSFHEIPGNHALQDVNDDFRMTTGQDGSGLWKIAADGIDDFLQTANIDFSTTDKITVVVAVRKLSTGVAMLLELGATALSNNAFYMTAPESGSEHFAFISGGSVVGGNTLSMVTAPAFDAPVTAVITGIGDIPADSSIIRANGVQQDEATGNQGNGNFSDRVLNIGSRNGLLIPYEGDIYGILVIDRLLTAQELSDTETYFGTLAGLSI